MATGFVTDVEQIRRRAREHIERGAVTNAYKADLSVVLRLLNEALATEIVCVLRYRRHYHMAEGIHSKAVAEEFLEHAVAEQEHADRIAARIVQLGGAPDYAPDGLSSRSATEYTEGHTLVDMIKEDLIAERVVIDTYADMIRYLGNSDPTTRAMLEDILASEEDHAQELSTLLATLDPTKPGG